MWQRPRDLWSTPLCPKVGPGRLVCLRDCSHKSGMNPLNVYHDIGF